MREVSSFRQVFRTPATIAAFSKSSGFFEQQCCGATTVAAAKDEGHQFKENNGGNGEGKWVTLPPFTSTVSATSLGKILTGRNMGKVNDSVETTITALKWVLRCCPGVPRSLIQKLFRLRQVKRECLEGDSGHGAQICRLKRVGAKDFMNEGDKILLPITVEGSSVKKRAYKCCEEELNFVRGLELYKDSAIIAINKPPKLPVQGGHGIKKSFDVLAARYLSYDYKDPPRLVHRLDRDCSGILVMGRTQTSTAVLHSIFREKTVGVLDDNETYWRKRGLQKRYLALVFGAPRQLHGLISASLAKVVVDDGKSERVAVVDNASSSQHAVTEYRVIETSTHGFTWLELLPLTGRKHQLRVHCAEVLGTPIVGDYKYGRQAHRKWEPLPYMALETDKKVAEAKSHHLGLDLVCGCIAEKQPHLHLHCKQMILPNISLALEHTSRGSPYDFSKLESLNLVAPLPWHMQRSWNLLKSLVRQDHSE